MSGENKEKTNKHTNNHALAIVIVVWIPRKKKTRWIIKNLKRKKDKRNRLFDGQ